MKRPAKPRLLGQMDQDNERDELRGAKQGRGGNDERKRDLVGLMPAALDREGVRHHAEAGQDDKGPQERA